MRAGALRRRVTVQARSVGQDAFGQQTVAWSDVLTNVPADIQALSGRELIAAQAAGSEVSHQISLRYHPALANPVAVAAMRVLYGSRIFEVASAVNVDEQNREITLTATEGLTQG